MTKEEKSKKEINSKQTDKNIDNTTNKDTSKTEDVTHNDIKAKIPTKEDYYRNEELLTIREAAELVQRTEGNIRKLLRKKRVPFVKMDDHTIRIKKEDLLGYYRRISDSKAPPVNVNKIEGVDEDEEKRRQQLADLVENQAKLFNNLDEITKNLLKFEEKISDLSYLISKVSDDSKKKFILRSKTSDNEDDVNNLAQEAEETTKATPQYPKAKSSINSDLRDAYKKKMQKQEVYEESEHEPNKNKPQTQEYLEIESNSPLSYKPPQRPNIKAPTSTSQNEIQASEEKSKRSGGDISEEIMNHRSLNSKNPSQNEEYNQQLSTASFDHNLNQLPNFETPQPTTTHTTTKDSSEDSTNSFLELAPARQTREEIQKPSKSEENHNHYENHEEEKYEQDDSSSILDLRSLKGVHDSLDDEDHFNRYNREQEKQERINISDNDENQRPSFITDRKNSNRSSAPRNDSIKKDYVSDNKKNPHESSITPQNNRNSENGIDIHFSVDDIGDSDNDRRLSSGSGSGGEDGEEKRKWKLFGK